MKTDSITLSRMRFHACHGALPAEKTQPQPWEISVTLELCLHDAGVSDDLTMTIDYRRIHAVVRQIIEGPPLNLVETLAESVAQNLLCEFPQVTAVVAEVVKPAPPVDFEFDGICVRVRRERSP